MQLADLHAFLFQEKVLFLFIKKIFLKNKSFQEDQIIYADTIARNLRRYPSLFVLFGHNLHLQFEPVVY